MTIEKTMEGKAAKYDEAITALDGRLGGAHGDELVGACEEYVAAEDHLGDRFDTDDYSLAATVGTLVQWWEATEVLRLWDVEPSVEDVLHVYNRARGAIDWAESMGYAGPSTPARFGPHPGLPAIEEHLADPRGAAEQHRVLQAFAPARDPRALDLFDQQWRALAQGLDGTSEPEPRLTAPQALVLLEGFGLRLEPVCFVCERSGGEGFREGDRWVHTACFHEDGGDEEPASAGEIAEPWEQAVLESEPDLAIATLQPATAANGPSPDDELGRALAELVVQVRRLRRSPCPTMGFGFHEPAMMGAIECELRELTLAETEEARSLESGDVVFASLGIAFAVAGEDPAKVAAALQRTTAKVAGRLDHMEGGGTWESAKALERQRDGA